MLTVVTWLWKSTGWRSGYEAKHVNVLQKMVAANLNIPHRFVCVTDMPKGIWCDTIPLWKEPDVFVMPQKPNCYRRLKAFSPDIRELFGDRFVSMDLDAVIMDDITPLLSRQEDFIMLKGHSSPYNGSLWMMNTGAREKVWKEFDPELSPIRARESRRENGKSYYGSDQAWISHKIPGEVTWSEADGIYQFWNGLHEKGHTLPANTKLVFFNGAVKPWDWEVKRMCKPLYETYFEYFR